MTNWTDGLVTAGLIVAALVVAVIVLWLLEPLVVRLGLTILRAVGILPLSRWVHDPKRAQSLARLVTAIRLTRLRLRAVVSGGIVRIASPPRFPYIPLIALAMPQVLLLPVYAPIYVTICLAGRYRRFRLRAKGAKPRLVWGPYPNYSSVEISKAMRQRGYVCDTIVYYNFDRIWDHRVFTFCLQKVTNRLPHSVAQVLNLLVFHHAVFLYVVWSYDIVHGVFYPGFLRNTLFERLEVQLLHLAGCRQINTTIGGDVVDMPHIDSHVIRQGIIDMYPEVATADGQKAIHRNVRYYCRRSDLIICQCSYMIDSLPRWDLLVTQYFPIDMEQWQAEDYHSDANGINGIVRIGHSPNHRPLKGSNFLIKAVQELRDEGYKIELVLQENHPNTIVKELLSNVDIIVADVVLQGYAVMAVEGMSLGKPVVQDISDPHYNRVFKLYTGLDEAPFVSGPIEDLKGNLRRLIRNPELRRELGHQGRSYVEKYHSFEANGRFWEWVYEDVWWQRRERVAFYHPDWPISSIRSLNLIVLDKDEAIWAAQARRVLEPARTVPDATPWALYPVTPGTFSTVHRLYRSRVLRSTDYLVARQKDVLPHDVRHLPQACIGLEELPAYGLHTLILLDQDPEIEQALVDFNERFPCYDLSINDLLYIRYPGKGQTVTKPYRRLMLEFASNVVPPLHYSNYAYINHLKRLLRPGMRVLDAFSGPGTIGLPLARECGLKMISLFDCNPAAVEMVRVNGRANFDRSVTITAYCSDLFADLPADARFDLIIGNPPHNLDRGGENRHLDTLTYIQSHDPELDIHRRFFTEALQHLAPGGRICLLENGESGCIEIKHLRELLKEYPKLEICDWQWMSGSWFYAVTIGFAGAQAEHHLDKTLELKNIRGDQADSNPLEQSRALPL